MTSKLELEGETDATVVHGIVPTAVAPFADIRHKEQGTNCYIHVKITPLTDKLMTKKTTDSLTIAGVVLSLGGMISSFAGIPTSSKDPSPFISQFGVSAHALFCAGVATLVCGVALILFALVPRSLRGRLRFRRSHSSLIHAQVAGAADLPELAELYLRQFGEDAPSLAQMRSWHSCNSSIFRIIVEIDAVSGARRIVASCKLVPLKNAVLPLLELGHFTGIALTKEHIVRFKGSACAWYVGDLVSTSRVSAVAVMREMVDFFSKHLREDKPLPIYARPLTKDGLKYLQDFHFEPIAEDDMELGVMCRLDWKQVRVLVMQLHSASRHPLRAPKAVADLQPCPQ